MCVNVRFYLFKQKFISIRRNRYFLKDYFDNISGVAKITITRPQHQFGPCVMLYWWYVAMRKPFLKTVTSNKFTQICHGIPICILTMVATYTVFELSSVSNERFIIIGNSYKNSRVSKFQVFEVLAIKQCNVSKLNCNEVK